MAPSPSRIGLTHLKQKSIFVEISNKIPDVILNLSKIIDCNNLTYYFKGESAPKSFIGFKGPVGLYKNIKDGCVTLEEARENQKKCLNQI